MKDSFFKKNKKIIIIVLVIVLIIVSIIVGAFFINKNLETNDSNSKNEYIAANTCPDKKVVENGQAKVFLGGKEYITSSENLQWIDQNCKDLNKDAAKDLTAFALDCAPRSHEYYRTQKAFAIDPNNNKIMFMAIEYKGVFKSIDGGLTWKKTVNGISAYPLKSDLSQKCYQEFGSIVIDKNDSNHVLVSRVETPGTIKDIFSENAGVWESKDGGENWQQMVSGTMNASGSKGIRIDPRDSKVMYYGINNMPASHSGADKTKYYNSIGIVYKTIDGGKSWTELDTGIQKDLRVIDMEMDPKNPDILYLGNFHVGAEGSANLDADQSKSFLMTKDAGKTWASLSSKLPVGFQAIYDISIAPTVTNNMFVVSQPTVSSSVGKSFYSTNGGTTFTQSETYIFLAEYDPFDTTGKSMLGYNPFSGSQDLYTSKDAGKTWQSLGSTKLSASSDRITNITFDTKVKNVVYLNGNNGILMKSVDGGKNWVTLTDYIKVGN